MGPVVSLVHRRNRMVVRVRLGRHVGRPRLSARSAGTRAPAASSALTVRARDAHRALPEHRHKIQPQDRHIASPATGYKPENRCPAGAAAATQRLGCDLRHFKRRDNRDRECAKPQVAVHDVIRPNRNTRNTGHDQCSANGVVEQGARLGLHRMAVDPVIQVRRNGDPVAVDVLAMPGLDPALVAGGLGFSSVAKPPTHLGLLMPVSGSLTRIT